MPKTIKHEHTECDYGGTLEDIVCSQPKWYEGDDYMSGDTRYTIFFVCDNCNQIYEYTGTYPYRGLEEPRFFIGRVDNNSGQVDYTKFPDNDSAKEIKQYIGHLTEQEIRRYVPRIKGCLEYENEMEIVSRRRH